MARTNLLKGIKRPKNIVFEHTEDDASYGRFIAYPFERGYGQTIGNSLRRILLSSIQGYAVAAMRIQVIGEDGSVHTVSSEFETVPHLVEDTSVIIQNLKLIQFKLPESMDDHTILVEWEGAGEMKGSDLAVDGVEVMNGDAHVCTTMAGAKLHFEIQINFGRGYVPAEVNDEYIEVVGALPIDSIYSPVKRVQVGVEDYRVGHRADYDKLILDIWTNGVVSPADALAEAAKISKEHLSIFINFDESSVQEEEEADEEEQKLKALLDTPVEELELSVRSGNCLKNANIKTLRELTKRSEDELSKTRNFGKKSMQEIKEKLAEWDLSLDMRDYSHIIESLRKGVSYGKKDS